MEHERKKKKFLVFLLIYLIMATSVLSIVTLSKYTSISSGNGSMQIAKWDVTINTSSNTSDNINLISGNNEISYTVKVKSLSDVKVGYTINVSNIPNDIQVKLDTGSYITPSGGKVSFSNAGIINADASTKEKTHTIYFTAPLGSATVNNKSISIDVVFVQLN